MSSLRSRLLTALPLAAALLCATGVAEARTFSATELSNDNALLSNFNLVSLGNVTGSGGTVAYGQNLALTEGRTIVGGNLITSGTTGYVACSGTSCAGNATVAVDSTGSKYGALTVFGNVANTNTSNVWSTNFQGTTTAAATAYVKGSANGNFVANGRANLNVAGSTASGLNVDNGKTITTATTFAGTTSGTTTPTKVVASAATVFPFSSLTALTTQVKSLATGIAALPGSPGVSAETLPVGTNVFFTAKTDFTNAGLKYGVVTTTVADLANQVSFKGVDNGTNDATLVIVRGDGANYTLPSLSSYAGSSKVIYDFVDATTLKLGGNWAGSILAPLATLTATVPGGYIDGSVIVASMNQSQVLYAGNLFTGNLSGLVPEPASLALLGAGLAAVAFVRRRRK